MSRTIEAVVYQYDELSEKAQEHARDWYRRASDNDTFWSECATETIKEACAILGVQIKDLYWALHVQGAGACFTGRYDYAKNGAAKIAEEWPRDAELIRIGRELQELQRRHFYGLMAVISHRGRGEHEQSVHIETYNFRTGNEPDSNTEETLRDLLRDLMRWAYHRLESEYEWATADEQVAETIIANEYEFDVDGCRV